MPNTTPDVRVMSTPIQPLVEAVEWAVRDAKRAFADSLKRYAGDVVQDVHGNTEVEVIAQAVISAIASRTSAERRAAVRHLIGVAAYWQQCLGTPKASEAFSKLDTAEEDILALLGVPPVPDAEIERLVERYGEAMSRWGGSGIDDYHRNIVDSPFSQTEFLHQEAVNAKRSLLAAIQQRLVVVDDAAVERACKAYETGYNQVETPYACFYGVDRTGMRAAIDALVEPFLSAEGEG